MIDADCPLKDAANRKISRLTVKVRSSCDLSRTELNLYKLLFCRDAYILAIEIGFGCNSAVGSDLGFRDNVLIK